jgi:hypothetical protein
VFIAHEGIAELSAGTAHERDGETGAAGDGVGERKRVKAAVGGRFGDGGVAGEELHENSMHQHGHRIVPGSDVGDEAQRRAAFEHGLDIGDVPFNAGDAAIDGGEGLRVGLGDFPHEQESDEFAVLLEGGETAGDAAALVKIGPRPGVGFGLGEFDGGEGGVEIKHGMRPRLRPSMA